MQYDLLQLFLHARSPREGINAINRTAQCEVVSLKAIFRDGFWGQSSHFWRADLALTSGTWSIFCSRPHAKGPVNKIPIEKRMGSQTRTTGPN